MSFALATDKYGLDMDRQIKKQLGLLGFVEFRRIAALPSQVEEYSLPVLSAQFAICIVQWSDDKLNVVYTGLLAKNF